MNPGVRVHRYNVTYSKPQYLPLVTPDFLVWGLIPDVEVLEILTQSVYIQLCEIWSPIDDIGHLA